MAANQGPRAHPLKPRLYYILLSLSTGDRHGLAIARDVHQLSDGQVRLWPATLYGSLDELCDLAWIEEVDDTRGRRRRRKRQEALLSPDARRTPDGGIRDRATRAARPRGANAHETARGRIAVTEPDVTRAPQPTGHLLRLAPRRLATPSRRGDGGALPRCARHRPADAGFARWRRCGWPAPPTSSLPGSTRGVSAVFGPLDGPRLKGRRPCSDQTSATHCVRSGNRRARRCSSSSCWRSASRQTSRCSA